MSTNRLDKNPEPGHHSPQTPAGAWTSIRLIAGREISTRVKTKSFVISTIITLVVIVGGGIGLKIFTGGDDGPETVSVATQGVGAAEKQAIAATGEAIGVVIEFDDVANADTARLRVDDEDVEAALLAGPQGYTLLSKDAVAANVEAAIRGGLSTVAVQAALAKAGVDPAAVTRQGSVALERTEPDDPALGQRIIMVIIGLFLMMSVIMGGGMMVAVGVVEEKTSRIVEILLATVKPAHLLWGKILGIGVLSFAQTILLGVTAFATGMATGLLTIPDLALTMAGVSLLWMLVGFLFFATLYAATGAMVSRQEEINGAAWPLMILVMGVLYASVFGMQAPDSTIMRVLAWVPPFSSSVVPMRVATGHASAVEIWGSFALMSAVCAVAVWASGGIYRRTVMRTGSRVAWKDALGMSRR